MSKEPGTTRLVQKEHTCAQCAGREGRKCSGVIPSCFDSGSIATRVVTRAHWTWRLDRREKGVCVKMMTHLHVRERIALHPCKSIKMWGKLSIRRMGMISKRKIVTQFRLYTPRIVAPKLFFRFSIRHRHPVAGEARQTSLNVLEHKLVTNARKDLHSKATSNRPCLWVQLVVCFPLGYICGT